jgi:hypothetical protein
MTFFPEKSKSIIDEIEKLYTSTTNTLRKRLISLPTTKQSSAWTKHFYVNIKKMMTNRKYNYYGRMKRIG